MILPMATTITLRLVLPNEASSSEYKNDPFYKHLDVEVVKYRSCNWIGKHKNVFNWWELENGIAVGWNESPVIGWSFPIKRVK